jgi:hypothetical protein
MTPPSPLLKELALRVGAIEEDPALLDHFLAPIFWVGIVLVVLGVITAGWPSGRRLGGRLQQGMIQIALLYAGVSLFTISFLCARVFCAHIDSDAFTSGDLQRCRERQLLWLCEIALVWGLGLAMVGGVSLLKVLWPMRKDRRLGDTRNPVA